MCEIMRFEKWVYPEILHNKLSQFNFLVQYPENLKLGYNTVIEAFTFISVKKDVVINDFVQIGSHCSIYSL